MPLTDATGKRMLYSSGIFLACVLCEFSALLFDPLLQPLLLTTAIRAAQLAFFILAIVMVPGIRSLLHAELSQFLQGIRTGLLWAFCFGLTAGAGGLILFFFGIDPFSPLRFSLPHRALDLILLYVTGAVVSPIVEELLFRGLIFTLLRPLGLITAVAVSSIIFAGFHLQGASIPVVQLIGGIVFALALERSGSIAAPIIIHVSGNLAIFSLSLL